MKVSRFVMTALFAMLLMVLGLAGPALAAGSYSGAGTSFQLTTYNSQRTGYLPSPPSTVPTTSTITALSYNIDWSSRSSSPGYMELQLCSTGTGAKCVAANRFNNTTTFFNGMPATTSFVIKAAWRNASPYVSGTLAGGPITVTDSITVSYS